MTVFKKRLGGTATATVLIALALLLACDAGFWLYNPSRFAVVLSSYMLNILHGTVEVQTPDTITWEEAKDGMKLKPGSRVSTGADSHALLTFSEGTTTKLEPGTDLLVAKLESDTIMLRQQSGRTWNQVAKLSDSRRRFEIQTPSANVMARGTLFLVNVDTSGRTFAQTTEGQVDVIAQGRTVNVFAGQQTEAKVGVPPSAPVPTPPARNELVVTVGAPASGMVIDPHGSRTGYLPGGASALNQIAGSRSSVQEESTSHRIVVTELSSGEYAVVLRGVDNGNADYRIEALGDGKSVFKYAGSYNATAAGEWLLLLHVNVVGGLLQSVSIVDPNSPGEGSSDTTKTGARTTEIEALGPTNHPGSDIAWPSAWDKVRPLGYWAAVAILVIFLTMIFAWSSRRR
ncbi:MAG: FecR family protein [Chloroflexota bacterium]|nr:FecR family protein [Chloroflexota bacterium]